MPSIQFETETLGLIVRNRRGLRVPINQRAYAWKKTHVDNLLTDLNEAITEGRPEYFLGSIIVVNPSRGHDTPEVYDGQQRLATTMILIAAIRDFFWSQLRDENEAETIQNESLISQQRRARELHHFTLSAADHEFFVARVLRPPTHADRLAAIGDSRKISHERIEEAAQVAATHVSAITQQLAPESQGNLLQKWLDFLQNGARVIWVEVADQPTAYRIFETMNDRGLKLSAADLVKNYLYSLAVDNEDEITNRWQSMTGTLESLGREDGDVVDYIRYFWITEHGHTRSSDLFDKIKREVNSASTALSWASKLDRRSNDYAALLTSSHDAWSEYHQGVRSDLDTLRYLGVSQVRPLLLAAFGLFSPGDMRKLIKNAVNWTVRCLITGVSSGTLEGHYSRNAKRVSEQSLRSPKDIADELASTIPDDDRFRSAVQTVVVPRASLARYYLREMQVAANGDEAQYLPSHLEPVTLEHILPQRPAPAWDIDADVAKSFYNRLGNQALLAGSVNSRIGNVEFGVKREALAASDFDLTSSVAECSDWGPEQIAQRQVRLSELAVRAWPFLV